MSDETKSVQTDGLWSRLCLIEGQGLPDRAKAYSALHDELARQLEGGARLDQRETPGAR